MIFRYKYVKSPFFEDNNSKIRINDVFPVGDGFVGMELQELGYLDGFVFKHMKDSKVILQHRTRNGLVNLRIVDIHKDSKIIVFEYVQEMIFLWYVEVDDYTLHFDTLSKAIDFSELAVSLSDYAGEEVIGKMWCQDEDARFLECINGISVIESNGELYYYMKDLTGLDYLNNFKFYF